MSAKKLLKRWPLPGFFIVILLMGLETQVASAQSEADVLRELEQTNAVLLRAKRLVIDENCPSKRARDLLIQARDIQTQAWGAYGHGQYYRAMKGTKWARELAGEAIKIAQRWRFVAKKIHRTGELLDVAAELVRVSQDPRATALMETALSQFERGKDALREGRIEQAFHMLKNAHKLALDIIQMLRDEKGGEGRLVRELERTDRLITKARPLIEENGDEKALVLLDRGLQTQIKAWEHYNERRYKVAYQLTTKARELVARALIIVEGPISPQRVIKAVAATDDLMARVRPVIMESQDQEAIDLFLAAGDHQDKAKASLAAERYKLALAQTKIARRLVDKALQLAGGA
jgi:cellobiose-specific phosphotransferase system component IIA